MEKWPGFVCHYPQIPSRLNVSNCLLGVGGRAKGLEIFGADSVETEATHLWLRQKWIAVNSITVDVW